MSERRQSGNALGPPKSKGKAVMIIVKWRTRWLHRRKTRMAYNWSEADFITARLMDRGIRKVTATERDYAEAIAAEGSE